MEDYHNYIELTAFLQNIADNYPDITSLESIGQSVQGREIWVMEISDNPSVNEIEGETRYVSISGHVKGPGKYELYEGNMTLYDLIFKAGGFADEEHKKRTYLKRAELVRSGKIAMKKRSFLLTLVWY